MSSSIRKSISSDALTRLAQAVAVAVSATLAGCQSTNFAAQSTVQPKPNLAAKIKQKPIWLSEKPSPEVPQDVWERMRRGFQLQDGLGVNPRIEQQRLWFASNPSFLENAGERGSLYIHYIVERAKCHDPQGPAFRRCRVYPIEVGEFGRVLEHAELRINVAVGYRLVRSKAQG
jgi:membrane-bound lytic murein transglycosylase D